MKASEKALTEYIQNKHTQEECIGFIDGWEEAEKVFYTKEQLLKAMVWAEDNGRKYSGTDKEGQLKQFEGYIERNFGHIKNRFKIYKKDKQMTKH